MQSSSICLLWQLYVFSLTLPTLSLYLFQPGYIQLRHWPKASSLLTNGIQWVILHQGVDSVGKVIPVKMQLISGPYKCEFTYEVPLPFLGLASGDMKEDF